MEPWTIVFANPQTADRVARAMRILLYNPDITGPDPNLPTLKYFPLVPNETREGVEDLFRVAQDFGRPVQIIPPAGYEEALIAHHRVEPNLNLGTIWPSGRFSDLTLQVGGRAFHVHRAVLVSVSDYFDLLFSRMRETSQSTIRLDETDAEIFGKLLDLIYLGLTIEDPQLLEVLVMAQRYQLRGLDYTDLAAKVIGLEPEDQASLIELLNQLFPYSYPDDIIEILEVTEVDPGLLPPREAERLVQQKSRMVEVPPGAREARLQKLYEWTPPLL